MLKQVWCTSEPFPCGGRGINLSGSPGSRFGRPIVTAVAKHYVTQYCYIRSNIVSGGVARVCLIVFLIIGQNRQRVRKSRIRERDTPTAAIHIKCVYFTCRRCSYITSLPPSTRGLPCCTISRGWPADSPKTWCCGDSRGLHLSSHIKVSLCSVPFSSLSINFVL